LISLIRSFFSSQLLKSSSIYLVGGLVSSGIPFLLLPVLTRYLTPADYGILAIINSLSSLLLNVVVFGQNSAYQRFYYDFDEKIRRRLFINAVIIITGCTVLTGALTAVLQIIIQYDFGFNNKWLMIILFIVYGNSIHLLVMGYIQITNRPLTHMTINTVKVFLIMFISIFFVVYQGRNWQGRVFGNLFYIILFLPIGFGFIFFSKEFEIAPSKAILKEFSHFGGGLLPGAVAGWGVNLADRLILDYFDGAATTGLYNIGYQFGFIVYIVVSACGRAWSPFFWENWLQKGAVGKKRIMKASRIILVGIFLLAVFVSLAGPITLRFMVAPEFYSASQYITLIAFGYAFQGFEILFSPYLGYHKKTLLSSYIAIAAVVVNIGLNIALIPIFGGQGAAIATLVAFSFSLLAQMVYAYKLEKISLLTIIKG
jgi:O-antigen/teichoic acid export membrane protein